MATDWPMLCRISTAAPWELWGIMGKLWGIMGELRGIMGNHGDLATAKASLPAKLAKFLARA